LVVLSECLETMPGARPRFSGSGSSRMSGFWDVCGVYQTRPSDGSALRKLKTDENCRVVERLYLQAGPRASNEMKWSKSWQSGQGKKMRPVWAEQIGRSTQARQRRRTRARDAGPQRSIGRTCRGLPSYRQRFLGAVSRPVRRQKKIHDLTSPPSRVN